MRIYADINRLPNTGPESSSVIIQVAPTPEVGASVASNGKFYVDVPDGVTPPSISSTSRLLGPNNVLDSIFEGLLARFPRYNYIHYNGLLTSADVDLLDLTAAFPASSTPLIAWATRAQVGRGGGVDEGLAANSVAVLPQNSLVSPVRPGVLITDTIDISADVPAGVDNFLVYWKIHEYSVTHDVMAYDGPNANQNAPAIKNLVEVDQEPSDFEVYLSASDGAGYSQVRRLVPCGTCDPGTNIRLAFVNKSAGTKRYLANYAILY